MTLAFILAIVLGVLTGRVTAVGARGGVTIVPLGRAALGAASIAMTFSLFVWGFASLSWYWPIAAFLLGNVAAFGVTRPSWPALFTMQPVFDMAVIGLGLYLWIAHWPF